MTEDSRPPPIRLKRYPLRPVIRRQRLAEVAADEAVTQLVASLLPPGDPATDALDGVLSAMSALANMKIDGTGKVWFRAATPYRSGE